MNEDAKVDQNHGMTEEEMEEEAHLEQLHDEIAAAEEQKKNLDEQI